MKVKICGIRTIEDAKFAEANGADFIGFVFAPSKRRVSIEEAAEIVSHLSEESKIVGVFVNESLDNMIRIAKAVQLDYIQLHGNELPLIAKELPYPVIKAFSIDKTEPEIIKHYPCEYLLLDSPGTTYEGGSGKTFDWSKLDKLDFNKNKLFLAGGLTPENVSKAVKTTQPIGVDVSSGVESAGNKDQTKIKQFIYNAKAERKVEENDTI